MIKWHRVNSGITQEINTQDRVKEKRQVKEKVTKHRDD